MIKDILEKLKRVDELGPFVPGFPFKKTGEPSVSKFEYPDVKTLKDKPELFKKDTTSIRSKLLASSYELNPDNAWNLFSKEQKLKILNSIAKK